MTASEDAGTPTYRIGAVSRLTQVPPETLRVWERRYGAVSPERGSGQTRLYNRLDVDRLLVMKQLVDRGHAISTVAQLDLPSLQARLDEHHVRGVKAVRAASSRSVPTFLVGPALSELARQASPDLDGVDLVGWCEGPDDLDTAVRSKAPRVLVWESPVVDSRTARVAQTLLRRSDASHVVVIYNFGTRASVERLTSGRVRAIRGPLNAYELKRAVVESDVPVAEEPPARPTTPLPVGIPERRFSNQTLARVSSISSTIACECPHHLASLVTQLAAFEQYSADCENDSLEDAELHAMLHRTTAQVRARLEDALAEVMKAEGIVP